MKKLILLELALLFLATTFQSDNPPGWYQQPLPLVDLINDVFFLDSLNGWIVTYSQSTTDTAYILKTDNGGKSWVVQFDTAINFNVVQFLDSLVGYVAGGDGRATILKTTNGGLEWQVSVPFGVNIYQITDLQFINKDTGWICSDDLFGGGIFKTTNAGNNWIGQTTTSVNARQIHFINKDTGWTSTGNAKIYRTNNGGTNWFWQMSFLRDL
ncbi:MAG: hypothetical protein IPM38_03210 [Ignavibacteria bacterium]|nr:hypothetical protein [Ignavibacteria bacterium]